ncbi:MAG TPA: hypothetical protein V6D02_02520, partial [Candidatus Obscuribacterales bacterium]
APHSFDRVLVDAPCSGEGNLRRRQRPRLWQAEHSARMAAAQTKLLSSALDLVKPGGTVVYSTCTFAPEENEAVLDAVLGDRAVVESYQLPGLVGQPGLTHWQGQTYRADLALAQRYWPHFNNTGGFFVAKLRRTEAHSLPPQDLTASRVAAPVDLLPAPPLQLLRERFAIAPADLDPYQCWATGKRRHWLLQRDCQPPAGCPPQTWGLSLATHTNLGLKPATAFLQWVGPHIHENVVTLPTEAAAIAFAQGHTQAITAPVTPGYVHVRFQGFELGCGRYVNGHLESQLPKILRWPPSVAT